MESLAAPDRPKDVISRIIIKMLNGIEVKILSGAKTT